MDAEIPDYIRAMGITRCTDFRAPRGFNDPHPILSYKLDTESIAIMNAQYQVAVQARNEEKNKLAVKILWDLAESGYAPANIDLSNAFAHGELGLKINSHLADIFIDRPLTVEDMIDRQQKIKHSWDHREEIREIVRTCRVREDLLSEKDQHGDNSTEETSRDSGSSIESITFVRSPLQDEDASQTRSASRVSVKKKDD